MRSKYDHPYIGFILGVIFPVIGFYVFYEINFNTLTLREYFFQMTQMDKITEVISLSVISNLLIFHFFLWKKFYYSVRGVILATLIFTLIVVVQKFLT